MTNTPWISANTRVGRWPSTRTEPASNRRELSRWDYSSPAWYFVTICTQNRKCSLGAIEDGELQLSTTGEIVAEEWPRAKSVWPQVAFDQFVVMPNHLHGIVILKEAPIETRLRGVSTPDNIRAPTLGTVVRQFKSHSTTRIWAAGNQEFRWQTRFHDRIIRGERALAAIRDYIANNPAKWALDKDNPVNWR